MKLALALCLIAAPAWAQKAVVVTTCGTLTSPYTAGTLAYPTVNTSGKLCTQAGALLAAPEPPAPAKESKGKK